MAGCFMTLWPAKILPGAGSRLPEDTMKAMANGTAPDGLSGDEAMFVRYTKELASNHKIKREQSWSRCLPNWRRVWPASDRMQI